LQSKTIDLEKKRNSIAVNERKNNMPNQENQKEYPSTSPWSGPLLLHRRKRSEPIRVYKTPNSAAVPENARVR
jgi:hypothetical protein